VAGNEAIAEFYDIGEVIRASIMGKLRIQKLSSSQQFELLTIYEVV
jgi:hypothetical protein